jgi:excinuclease UvrABC nuclease subunit
MGLCRPCPSDIENEKDLNKKSEMRRLYKRNITYIKMVLTGRMKSLKKELVTKMNTFSNDERFEEAQSIKKLLEQLNYVTQPVNATSLYLENPNLVGDIRTKELQQLTHILSPFFDSLSKIHRIECYDIAHIAGSYPTASMVTFIDGEADKTYYRHFKITPTKGGDDYASLSEVATRRKKHFDDWGKPDLIIVDGGKGQLKAFLSVFAEFEIPIVGLAKREETLVIQNKTQIPKAFSEIRVPDGPVLHLVQRIRNEAHRFARRLHHKLVSKALTGL